MTSILTTNPNPGNFANRPTEEVQAIARKGGLAAHGIVEQEQPVVNNNPGNFANRPTDEVKGIARKGGLAAHGIVEDKENVNTKEEKASKGAEEVVADIPEVRKTRSQVTTRLDEQMAEGL